jgi:oligopeptidase B
MPLPPAAPAARAVSACGPAAPQRPIVHVQHGDARPDPYAWLSERGAPAALAHLEMENRHLATALAHTGRLQERLYGEMSSRLADAPGEPPHTWGPYAYYTRVAPGQDHPVHCRAPAAGGAEEVLLDLNRAARPGAYVALRAFAVSPDHGHLAYALDETGEERFTVRVRDLARGGDLPDTIEATYGEVVWSVDGRTLFYTTADAANRPFRLMRHALGSADADACLYEEADPAFFAHVRATASGRFLVLTLRGRITTECRVLDLRDTGAGLRTLFRRRAGIRYEPVDQGDLWYVRTSDGAPGFRVVSAPIGGEDGSWTEVLAARDGVELTSLEAFARHLVIHERDAGVPHVRVVDAHGAHRRAVLPAWAMSVRAEVNRDYTAATYRVLCASPIHPPRVLEIPLDGGDAVMRGLSSDPAGHRPDAYRVERLSARSHDGQPVPLTIVSRIDRREAGGGNPTLLTGYGAYGMVEDLGFRSDRLSLLDRGVVLAVAHVRGGGFLGPDWYAQGRRRGKENAVRDFVACAEHLLNQGIARPGALAVHGASAGGVLVGAALNRRPELFGAAIAEAPFVDVLTTSLDETLPGTVAEWEEWGDPHDPGDYAVMRGYSPYDCITPRPYPHVLATTSLNDWRVGYWEAAKWVARLRSATTRDARILLKVEMNAGHHGRTGRYQRIEDLALQYAFLLDSLQVEDSSAASGAGGHATGRAA